MLPSVSVGRCPLQVPIRLTRCRDTCNGFHAFLFVSHGTRFSAGVFDLMAMSATVGRLVELQLRNVVVPRSVRNDAAIGQTFATLERLFEVVI